MKVFLRDREHASRSHGRVVHSLDDALGGENFRVRVKKYVHHKTDDLAWGKVVSRFLVRRFIEPAYQFLKDIAHFDVGDLVGV